MLASPIRRALPALGFAAAAAPWSALLAPLPVEAQAQVREVVSKEVSVGRASAELRLEFGDGGALAVALTNGSVQVDGRAVGSYEPGDALDAAWRSLLGQAVALDDGPLAEALVDWSPPADLPGEAAETARRIDQAMESAVRSVQAQASAPAAGADGGNAGSLVRALLRSAGRLGLLEEALAGLDADVRVHVGEDVEVPAGEVVASSLIVVDGDARVGGRVDGDIVVLGGSLELLDGSSVSGSVRLVDATLLGGDDGVARGVVDVQAGSRELREELRTELRNEIRNEIRDELRRELRGEMRDRDRGFSLFAPFRPVFRGIGGVLENLVAIFVLALIGAGVIAFGGDKVEVIAETARRSPGRSAAVGMAATILLIPIWVLGFIALLVSIIGIPVAIAWLPLFPLAACAAGVVGYLAVARNAGEWLADSDYPWTHWIRKSNTLVTTVGGLVGLMALFIAANVVSMAPFLGAVTGLLVAAGAILTIAAVQMGLGAVILTRGGRRREHWSTYAADEAWEAAMKVEVEEDVEDVEKGGKTHA